MTYWPVRILFSKRPVEVEGGTNESQVSKGLRKITEGFSMMAGFFGKQSEMISVSKHLLKHEPGFFQSLPIRLACAGHRFHEPEGTEIKGAFFSIEAIVSFR
jgi:hypothetical protein